MLPPVSRPGADGFSEQPANSIASDPFRGIADPLAQPVPAAALGGLQRRSTSGDLHAMSNVLTGLFAADQTPRPKQPPSLATEALRLDVLSSALPALPPQMRPATARRLGDDIHGLSSPVHEGRTLRTLVESALTEAPDTMIAAVLRVSPDIPPEDKATMLNAIVSDPANLRPLPRSVIEKIFDRICVLPERYQFELLSLLLRNSHIFSRAHQATVIRLHERVVGAVRARAQMPDSTISPARAIPQLGLLEITESLFDGIESHVDRLSPQSSSSAAAADRVVALASAAPAALELVGRDGQSKDLVKALSTHLIDRILELEEPRHRFSALLGLVSKPRDKPAFVEALAGNSLPHRGNLLDFEAITRIIDTIPGLASHYRAVLLEAMLPECLHAGNEDESAIIIKRVAALLLDVDHEDRVPPLQKLVSCQPLSFANSSERLPIAGAIRDVIFAQGPTVPPKLLTEFVTNIVRKLPPGRRHEFTNQIVQFVMASPRDLQRSQAKALLSSNAMPSYTEVKLRSMARDS